MITEEKVIEVVNQSLNMKLDPATTPRDATLKSLGIDSLDFYNVLVELESITGRKIPDEDVENMSTIQEIAKYFA